MDTHGDTPTINTYIPQVFQAILKELLQSKAVLYTSKPVRAEIRHCTVSIPIMPIQASKIPNKLPSSVILEK